MDPGEAVWLLFWHASGSGEKERLGPKIDSNKYRTIQYCVLYCVVGTFANNYIIKAILSVVMGLLRFTFRWQHPCSLPRGQRSVTSQQY